MANISKKIIEEIETKQQILKNRDENWLYFLLGRKHLKTLQQSAAVHSFKMEYSEEDLNSYTCHSSGKQIKKGRKNLENAYSWANSNFDPVNLDEEFIKNLAWRIDPDFYPNSSTANYRGLFEQVRVSGASWTPPYSDKIPLEMEKFIKNLKEMLSSEEISSQVEASCYANFQLIRIHPFNDGNGRTSRILQNTILKQAELPPIDIYPGERFQYYQLLDSAVQGYRFESDGHVAVSPQEKELYNYLAGKISSSLDLMLEKKLI